MQATGQYFLVVLLIMLYKIVLSTVLFLWIKNPKCDHSNASYWAVLSCGTVYYAAQGGSNRETVNETLRVGIQRKATEQYFPVVLFIILHKFVLTFKTVIETPSAGIQMKATEDYFPLVSVTCAVKNCGTVYYGVQGSSYSHSNESYWAVLSCGTACLSSCTRWFSVDKNPNGPFTWRWRTPGRWDNLLWRGNPPVQIISHFNLISFTW